MTDNQPDMYDEFEKWFNSQYEQRQNDDFLAGKKMLLEVWQSAWNRRADLCAAVQDAPTPNTPGTLLNEQRTSQPEMTGSSEVDRSERVLIAPTDKERDEALEAVKYWQSLKKPHAGISIIERAEYDQAALDVMTGHAENIKRALTAPDHTRRIQDLLEANNRYLQRARDAEQKLSNQGIWTDDMKHAAMQDAAKVCEQHEVIKALSDALQNAENLCKALVEGYPNPDITHVDYRVQATKWAQDFLLDDAKALALAAKAGGA